MKENLRYATELKLPLPVVFLNEKVAGVIKTIDINYLLMKTSEVNIKMAHI